MLASKEIIKQFGGEIFIESQPNKGSIFTMKFKLVSAKTNIKYISEESSLEGISDQIKQNCYQVINNDDKIV